MDDHLILEVENVLSTKLCEEIIDLFEKDPNKVQSVIYNPINHSEIIDLKRRDSLELYLSNIDGWSHIDKKLSSYLTDCLSIYKNELCKKIEKVGEDPDFLGPIMLRGYNLQDNGYVINRINKNSEYRWHHDDFYNNKVLRCIWYLNDMCESDGGRTEFLNGRTIKPKAGKVVIFPTTWIHAHCGTKVLNNYKYIITTDISIIF
jgi:hypothetical protein